MRVPQKAGVKGSLKRLQDMLGQRPNPIDGAVRTAIGLGPDVTIDWRSPKAGDDNAEYRDAAFLERLGLERLSGDLRSFWPTRGPQWDALAVTSDGKVILVEAKAHVGELASTCDAGAKARKLIDASLSAAKKYYGAAEAADWATGYYQYANRLAHLMFLRKHGVDAHLVFIYFLNDRDVRGPAAALGWDDVIDDCHDKLGLERHSSVEGVHSAFVDVA